jgi:hypothetical protein
MFSVYYLLMVLIFKSYLLLPKLRLLPNPLLLEPELLLCPNPPLRTRLELLRVPNDRCDLTGLLKLLRLLALDDIDDELVGLNVLYVRVCTYDDG